MRKDLTIFFGLLLLSFFLMLADQNNWLGGIRTLGEKPVFKLQLSLRRTTPDRCAPIQKEAFDQSQLSSCLAENERLKKLLGAPLPPAWKFLPAQVVGVAQKMLLDKGEQDGVKVGQMVVFENILVGRVAKTSAGSAQVILPLSPGIKIPVLTKRPNLAGFQAKGLLENLAGRDLFLTNVLLSESLAKGDLVVTAGELAGENVGWLPDLLIGRVLEIFPKTREIFQKAKIEPLIDYQNLKEVFVVLK